MKKKRRQAGIRLGPIIFFVLFCILGGLAGILINNRYYASERGELTRPQTE